MMNNKSKGRGVSESTKDAILISANEMISEVGMVDFKIDMLSTLLSLSPGNITYHFPKKEDIATALWDKVVVNIEDSAANYLTPILDIKQLFLLLRTIFIDNFEYRGVVAYKLGDARVLNDTMERSLYLEKEFKFVRYVRNAINVLQMNGYINKITKFELNIIEESIVQLFFWGFIDKETLSIGDEDISLAAQYYANYVLFPLIPFFTKSGLKQYNEVSLPHNK